MSLLLDPLKIYVCLVLVAFSALHIGVSGATVSYPITQHSCEAGSEESSYFGCIPLSNYLKGTDFSFLGPRLNDGRATITKNDDECCRLCQKTSGCWSWTRAQERFSEMPEGACWLLPISPKRTAEHDNPHMNTGINPPRGGDHCAPRVGVRFTALVPYNDPELLVTVDYKECCDRCQDQSQLCYGWTYFESTGHCLLYGNDVTAAREQKCSTCFSGVSRVHTAPNLGNEGIIGKSMEGLSLTRRGAFRTDTSEECAGICDSIQECRSWSWKYNRDCILNADVPPRIPNAEYGGSGTSFDKSCTPGTCGPQYRVGMEEEDIYTSRIWIPDGHSLLVDTPEDCCKICRSIPECKSWTFNILSSDKYIELEKAGTCWLKDGIPYLNHFYSERDAVSGVIEDRLSKPEHKRFHTNMRLKEWKEDDGFTLSTGTITAIVAAAVVISVACLLCAACFSCYRARRQRELIKKHGAQLRPKKWHGVLSQEEANPEPYNSIQISTPVTLGESMGTGVATTQKQGISEVDLSTSIESTPTERVLLNVLGDGKPSKFNKDLTPLTSANVNKLLGLRKGTYLAGKYRCEGGCVNMDDGLSINAQLMDPGTATAVQMKFFEDEDCFLREREFYARGSELECLPQLLDVFDAPTVGSWNLPELPCIVLERGDYSFTQYLSIMRQNMDGMERRTILYKVTKALDSLHQHGIVHMDISPSKCVLFARTLIWKLMGYGKACEKGTGTRVHFSSRYTCPEMLLAMEQKAETIIAKPSADMWALGLLFWEVLTGEPLLGQEYDVTEVMRMLMGSRKLPFEEIPQMWDLIKDEAARRITMNLLRRNPLDRWPAKTVLANGFFASPGNPGREQLPEAQVSVLGSINDSINHVEARLGRVVEVGLESLKHDIGGSLVICMSFHEISPDEFLNMQWRSNLDLVNAYKAGNLKTSEALLQPTYNPLKEQAENPASMLRVERQHLIKITVMSGSHLAMELPVAQILSCKLWPVELESDLINMDIYPLNQDAFLMEGVGIWRTTDHNYLALKMPGTIQIGTAIGLQLNNNNGTAQVRKQVEVLMHKSKETFAMAKRFYRTSAWFSNLPEWAKVHIHGVVACVKVMM